MRSPTRLFLVAALLLPLNSALSATIKVKAGESIQTAIDLAAAGDRIQIAAGTYPENLVIDVTKTGLSLVGKGSASKVIIDARPSAPTPTGPGILIQAADVDISNLTVRHAHADEFLTFSGHGIEVVAEKVHLNDVIVYRAQMDGVHVDGLDFRADGCTVVGCGEWGINVQSGSSADIWNCKVSQCVTGGIRVDSSKADVVKNTVELIKEGEGIRVNGNDAEVLKNVVRGTGQELIRVVGDDAVVFKNKLSAGAHDGIKLDGSGFLIANNKISQLARSGDGIRVINALFGGTVRKNTISQTAEAGIDVTFSTDVVISENSVTDCGSALIPSINASLTVSQISILNNKVLRGQGDGIHVDGDSNLVESNVITACLEDGIDMQAGTGNQVRSNRIRNCHAEGLENNATDTVAVGNNSKGSRLDFANDGTLATDSNNVYSTGGPAVPPTIDD